MRRFLRIQRDEDYEQIPFLTAKCNRLACEKALLEAELLVSAEREKSLRNDLEAVSARLCQQELINAELHSRHEQQLGQMRHQQVLLELLQQHLCSVADEDSRDAGLLHLQVEQVSAELHQLQGSEEQLENLVEELHRENLKRTTQLDELRAQLESKTQELEELQRYHQGAVQELHDENQGSLRKLQETAEQFEWLCEQQRNWMCCVKRFKDCMTEDKEALLSQIGQMETELMELRKSSEDGVQPNASTRCPSGSDNQPHSGLGRSPSWDIDLMAALQAEVDKWRCLYKDLCSKLASHSEERTVDRYQKPP